MNTNKTNRWVLPLIAAVCVMLSVTGGPARAATRPDTAGAPANTRQSAAPAGDTAGGAKAAHNPRPAAPAARQVNFVTDGKPVAAIVLPDDEAPIAKAGADELVDFVKHCTGAKLPIVHEKDGLPQGIEQGVYIGKTKAAQAAGVHFEQLKPDEYRILTRDHKLILAGKDRLPEGVDLAGSTQTNKKPGVWHGSYYATISLIRKDLGGAFLWPGDLGTVYPESRTLSATVARRDFATPFVMRRLWNAALNQHRYIRPAHELGYSEQQIKHKQKVTKRYFLRQGGGASQRIDMGHSFRQWWEKYHKTHPDYFALQPTGVRGPVPHAGGLSKPTLVKLHVANPALVKPIMKEADELFSAHPEALTLPIAVNDGTHIGFCMDPLCKAWDNLDAKPYLLRFAKKNGDHVSIQYHFLTDRYARFWTRISKTFAKKYPDKLLFVYAYGALQQPPVNTPLPDDLLVSFVPPREFYGFDQARRVTNQRWDGWAEKGAKLLFRPNYLHFARALPVVYVHKFSRDIKHAYKTGMIGGIYDIIHHSWATRGLNDYVFCRLLFNPELPVDQVIDDFAAKAFGKAAPKMQRYFAFLEHTTDALAARPPASFGWDTPDGFQGNSAPNSVEREWMVQFTARLAQAKPRLDALFHQARQAVPEHSRQARRIDFMRQGLRYALLMNDAFTATSQSQRQEAIKAFKQFLKNNRHTFVIDRPFIKQNMQQGYDGVADFLSQQKH